MKAYEIKNKISENSLAQKTEFQEDNSFLSPAYLPVAIHYSDIVNQEVNPNIQVESAFKALQTSILNTGYTFPVLVSENPLYDPTLDPKDKPDFRDRKNRVVEVRDPKVRAYFKYKIVDGSHRFAALLENDEIFERENGYIPCSIIRGKNEHELMSCEVLMNPVFAGQKVKILRGVKKCIKCGKYMNEDKINEDNLCIECAEEK